MIKIFVDKSLAYLHELEIYLLPNNSISLHSLIFLFLVFAFISHFCSYFVSVSQVYFILYLIIFCNSFDGSDDPRHVVHGFHPHTPLCGGRRRDAAAGHEAALGTDAAGPKRDGSFMGGRWVLMADI